MTTLRSIITCAAVFAIQMLFAYTETVDGITWSYTVANGVASVGSESSSAVAVPTSTSGAITIPSTLGGYPVTSIGWAAFYFCDRLTNVTIPDSVTNIAGRAFAGCSGLTSMTIPDGVTSIEQWTFNYCNRLTNVTIPDSVTSIGYEAFTGCSSLTSVTIPASVTSIGSEAFTDCGSLTNVTISEGVTSIGTSAFSGCNSLTHVTIPDSVTSIGNGAFEGCHAALFGTTTVSGLELVDGWVVGSSRPLSGDLVLTGARGIGDKVFSGFGGLTSVTIPDSVTSIGSGAFSGCIGLTSVTIPDGVTSIGQWAFKDCSGLTSVMIPDSVTSIGYEAFAGCSGLTSITIPQSVLDNGVRNVFSSCYSSFTNVSYSSTITNIGSSAFSGCSSLINVTIPDSVTSIEASAFSDCSGLTNVTIPGSVTNIEARAFSGCSGLTSVTIPASVTSIGYDVFYGCRGLTSVTVPQCVLDRGIRNVFSSCYSSLTNVSYSSVISRIGSSAFSDCSGLTSVTIPGGVTNNGVRAFFDCSGLTSVTIPNSVTSIGGSAFSGCNNLEAVYISDLASWCGISFSDNPLNYAHNLYLNGVLVTQLTIPSGVTSIKARAFSGCSELTNVTIPNSVTKIGNGAFSDCSGLTSVTIPNSVTSIEGGAFYGCIGLTNMTIPEGVTSIGASAFSGCIGLTNITIPESVTSIGASAFSGCSGLTSVTLPGSVTNFGADCFEGCPVFMRKLYQTILGAGAGGGSAPASTTIVQQVEAPYALTDHAADRAIASVTVNSDCAIDSFVLKDGKVYDSMLRIVNTADHAVKLTLPSGYVYETFKGVTPLTIPANSRNILSITRTAAGTLLGSREGLETVQGFGAWPMKRVFGKLAVCMLALAGASAHAIPIGVRTMMQGRAAVRQGISTPVVTQQVWTVMFNANGGTIAETSRVVTNECAVGELPVTTRDGHTFDGWFTALDGGSRVSDETVVTTNVTFYAHWTAVVVPPGPEPEPEPEPQPEPQPVLPQVWTVTFDANGGEGSMAAQMFTNGVVQALEVNAFTRFGWEFAGWATSVDGEVVYGDGQWIAVSSGQTLYAQWREVIACRFNMRFARAQTVLGALYGKDGKPVGTVQMKVGKVNKKKRTVKIAATATLLADGKAKKVAAKAVTVKVGTAAAGTAAPHVAATITFKAPIGKMAFEMEADGTFKLKNNSYVMAEKKVGGSWTRAGAGVYVDVGGGRGATALPAGTIEELLPDGEPVIPKAGKWSFAKAAGVKYAKDKKTKVASLVVDTKKGKNLSGMKLTYVPKTGIFKGSFKIYAIQGGKLKKFTAKVVGVVVDGKGWGSAAVPKGGRWGVTVE